MSPANTSLSAGKNSVAGADVWPGRLDDAAFHRANLHGVALAHGFVDLGDAAGFAVGRHHPAAVAGFELLDAAGVVAVVMRHQDVGEFPAGRLQRGLDRSRLRRVDGCGPAA